MATLTLGIIGAGIGAATGGWAGARAGWAIGTTVGGIIEQMNRPATKQDVGKLTDLRLSGSSYGASIPYAWGHVRVGSNVVWIAENAIGQHLVEHTKTESHGGGGSGGGGSKVQTTNYTYTTSFASALFIGGTWRDDNTFRCAYHEGSPSRIWADDELIWDRDGLAATYTGSEFYNLASGSSIDSANGLPTGTYAAASTYMKSVYYDVADKRNKFEKAMAMSPINFRFYKGSNTQTADTFMSSWVTSYNARYLGISAVPAYREIAYLFFEDLDVTNYGNRIPNISVELDGIKPSLADIVLDMCASTGLDVSTQVDASAGAETPIDGYVISSRTSAQDALNPVLQYGWFKLPEIDGQLKLVPKLNTPSVSVPYGHLGASVISGGLSADQDVMTCTIPQFQDLPGKVEINYISSDNGRFMQSATQIDVRQLDDDLINVVTLQYSLTMTDYNAKTLASRILDTSHREGRSFNFKLPIRYLGTTVTDVITVDWNGVPLILEIQECELGLFGEMRCKAVLAENTSTTYTNFNAGSGVVNIPTSAGIAVPASFFAWSGKEIRDEDQIYPGFYVGATGPYNWTGGGIYYSVDGGASYVFAQSIPNKTAVGLSTTTLGAGTAGVWDTVNTVTVTLDDTGELQSSTDAAVLAGLDNWAYIGGEYIGFVNATLVSGRTYTLSRLRRGGRGTTVTAKASGSNFVKMESSVARVPVATSLQGTTVKVKVVSSYQEVSDVTAIDVVIAVPTTPAAIAGLTTSLSEKMRWLSEWSSATAYVAGDTVKVTSDKSVWVAKIAGTNKNPLTQPSYWDLVLRDTAGTTPVSTWGITMLATDAGVPILPMSVGQIELNNNAFRRARVDLTGMDACKTSVAFESYSGPTLLILPEYSTDGTTWNGLCVANAGILGGTGTRYSGWKQIRTAARTEVFLRVSVYIISLGGGSNNASIGNIHFQFSNRGSYDSAAHDGGFGS